MTITSDVITVAVPIITALLSGLGAFYAVKIKLAEVSAKQAAIEKELTQFKLTVERDILQARAELARDLAQYQESMDERCHGRERWLRAVAEDQSAIRDMLGVTQNDLSKLNGKFDQFIELYKKDTPAS